MTKMNIPPYVGQIVLYVGLNEAGQRQPAVPALVLEVGDDHEVDQDPNLALLVFRRSQVAKEYRAVPPADTTASGSGWLHTQGTVMACSPMIVVDPAQVPADDFLSIKPGKIIGVGVAQSAARDAAEALADDRHDRENQRGSVVVLMLLGLALVGAVGSII